MYDLHSPIVGFDESGVNFDHILLNFTSLQIYFEFFFFTTFGPDVLVLTLKRPHCQGRVWARHPSGGLENADKTGQVVLKDAVDG